MLIDNIYITQNIFRNMEKNLGSYLTDLNPWWLTERVDRAKDMIEREGFSEILQDLGLDRMIQILGPRRAGKTTILYLIIDHLLSKGIPSRNVLYLSLDDPLLQNICENPIFDPIERFLDNIAGDGTKFIFLDEVQDIEGWYKWLKAYHDKKLDLKFFISGSSGLKLQNEANIYLRGRVISIVQHPLSFREFLMFSGVTVPKVNFKDNDVDLAKGYSVVSRLLEKYLVVGGFPEFFEIDPKIRTPEKWFRILYEDVPKKAFYEDVVKRFNIRNPASMELLFAFIAQNQGQILSYESMNRVAGLDKATLLDYLQFLKSTYLLVEIGLRSDKLSTTVKAKKKYLVLDQGIRNGILREYYLNENNRGFVVENVVGVHLHRFCEKQLFDLSYIRSNGEIDFVVTFKKRSIPIEVKTSDNFKISKEMRKYLKANNSPHGVVITDKRAGEFKTDGFLIRALPLWVFLTGEIKKEIWD